MFSKRAIYFFIVYVSLSMVVLLTAGCPKSGNNQKAVEEGEIIKGDKPKEMEPNITETKIEEPETKTEDLKSKDTPEGENPVVLMETSIGSIKIELFQKDAPITVKNFMDYVNENFYIGTIFHRVVPSFVIQGGGFTEDMTKKSPTRPAIKNEAMNGISNTRGTLAMARTPYINSATSQFFINLRDNLRLDHKDETAGGYGYCVFGKVIDGMDVVDNIARVPIEKNGHYDNVPVKPIIIKSVKVLLHTK